MRLIVLLVVIGLTVPAVGFSKFLTDAQVKERMIEESINSYSGSCPCPYNTTRNGSRCGKRSAWSKPGGAEPLCYDNDISDEMVDRYRKRRMQK